MAGPVGAIDKQDILPAIGVVVEERAARSERLWKQLAAVGSAIVEELKAGRPGYIDQLEPRGREDCARRAAGIQQLAEARLAIPGQK